MNEKIKQLGILIASLEKLDNRNGMKHLLQENTGRFFVHKDDFVRITNSLAQKAIQYDLEPVIFTGNEIDNFDYNKSIVEYNLFEGYYSV